VSIVLSYSKLLNTHISTSVFLLFGARRVQYATSYVAVCMSFSASLFLYRVWMLTSSSKFIFSVLLRSVVLLSLPLSTLLILNVLFKR
jgi:hypothetical protein